MLDHTAPSSESSPAFASLVAQHLPAMRRRASRIARGHVDADDLVQDALLRAFRGQASLRSPDRAAGWLLAIVSNAGIDRARRRRRRQEVSLAVEPAMPEPVADQAPPWDHVTVEDVRAAAALLPDDVRATFHLATFDGLAYATIARQLGVPRATVGTRLLRARRRMRQLLLARRSA